MQQFQFVVGDRGLLSEPAASEQAGWYVSKCPDLDPLDFEAHIMLMRAYGALKTDAPFERRGGMTKARYNVLRMLLGSDGHRKQMTDIVVGMNVSPTNITKLVDGLERDGYVRRAGNLRDKRKVWVELLPAGADLVEDTMPDVVRHVSSLWQGLTREDKRVLVHLLAKLRLDILTRSAEGQIEGVSTHEALQQVGV
jgi:DNA-binding MarR family transcriptional regulator